MSFGYADNASDTHQPSPGAFPAPWQGDRNVNFVGQGPKFESGAIRIENPSDRAVMVQQATVDVGSQHYDLWGGPLKVPAHGSLILTQTDMGSKTPVEPNFDTSEQNSSPGSGTPAAAVLHLRVNGHDRTVSDSQRILTTGGRDVGNDPGNPNESHGWAVAGAITVDEPASAGAAQGIGWAPVAGGLIALLTALPALLAALLLLILAWLLARLVAHWVALALARAGLDAAVERFGILPAAVRGAGLGTRATVGGQPHMRSLSWVLGWLAGLFVFLLVLVAVAQALHLSPLTALLATFLFFLPNLVVGILILALGMLLAGHLAGPVAAAARRGGFPAGPATNLVQALVVLVAATAALIQIGVGAPLVLTLFGGLCIALALALGLAFGLGGQDAAREILDRLLSGRRRLS